jgi:hypothetical protein
MSATIVAVMVAKARQRITRHFLDAGATAPDKAVAFEPGRQRIERRMFRRMVDHGAIVEAKGGRYWLDEARLRNFRTENLARMLGIIGVLGLAAAGAIAFGS